MVPGCELLGTVSGHSPRIRGDGPSSANPAMPSPAILPVFAGMVPAILVSFSAAADSPRIRGDGPVAARSDPILTRFSPYSRGWSRATDLYQWPLSILPVFAGMVLDAAYVHARSLNSPRIRGDGPPAAEGAIKAEEFSPYSRGWSHRCRERSPRQHILPVFAGMVPPSSSLGGADGYSPRIRGDGPIRRCYGLFDLRFSPYSRGWSPVSTCSGGFPRILPVFAGMVRSKPPPCRSLMRFSPYSRGWSLGRLFRGYVSTILPVFAGMVPASPPAP